MAGPLGTSIPLAVSKPRRRVVGYLLALHGISAADAVEYVPQTPEDRSQFEAMRALGIIREAGPGLYWIDLAALKADEDARRRRLVPVVIAACVVLALVLTFFYRG